MRSPTRAVSGPALATGGAGVSGTTGIVTHRGPVHQRENPEGLRGRTRVTPAGSSGHAPFRRVWTGPTVGDMTARDETTRWPERLEPNAGGGPAVSMTEEGRYYASWLIGLAAVGVALFLASDREALHVLATAVWVVVTWTFAVGFSLLLI